MRPVDLQPVADRAAEQFVDRDAQGLRLDVDERVLDRRDRHLVDAARRLPRRGVERRRDALDRPRVLANEVLGQFADDRREALRAIALHVFRPADEALVGGDLEERIDPPAGVAVQILYFDDFHGHCPPPRSRHHHAPPGQAGSSRERTNDRLYHQRGILRRLAGVDPGVLRSPRAAAAVPYPRPLSRLQRPDRQLGRIASGAEKPAGLLPRRAERRRARGDRRADRGGRQGASPRLRLAAAAAARRRACQMPRPALPNAARNPHAGLRRLSVGRPLRCRRSSLLGPIFSCGGITGKDKGWYSPTTRCASYWKRASISATTRGAGTRRWRLTSSGCATASTSSTSNSRCRCSDRGWRRSARSSPAAAGC